MNWDDIRYFLAVWRARTLSGAGKSLDVNHTTVSRRIAELEASLGTRLFDRGKRGLQLTQAGEDLRQLAVGMEESAHGIQRRIAGKDSELRGSLTVTVPYDFVNNVLMPDLGRFLELYPRIDLELMTTTSMADLAAREADVAIRLTAAPPDFLVGRKLMPLRHGLYVQPDYWSEHRDAPHVVLFRSREEPDWVKRHFSSAEVALRVDSMASMVTAVRHGFGIARMPCFIGDSEPDLRRLDVELPPSDWGVWCLNHADLRATARVRAGREFLQELILARRELIAGEASLYL